MIGGHWDLFEKFQLVHKILSMENIGCYYMRRVRYGGAMRAMVAPQDEGPESNLNSYTAGCCSRTA